MEDYSKILAALKQRAMFEANPELERGYIGSILESNKDKNFARRILVPEGTPGLPLDPAKGQGNWGTHMMSYGTNPRGAMVYPEIIQREEGAPLERLSRQDAAEYARRTGQNIQFDNPDAAAWFGQNYKKYWKK